MGSIGTTKTFSPEELPPPWKLTPADITIDNHKDGDKGKILFKNVNIFDSTGADIYPGDVLIEGQRIKQVGKVDFTPDDDTLVIDGKGKKTLMSGLCDAHTHLS
jgi:adenine deaminase